MFWTKKSLVQLIREQITVLGITNMAAEKTWIQGNIKEIKGLSEEVLKLQDRMVKYAAGYQELRKLLLETQDSVSNHVKELKAQIDAVEKDMVTRLQNAESNYEEATAGNRGAAHKMKEIGSSLGSLEDRVNCQTEMLQDHGSKIQDLRKRSDLWQKKINENAKSCLNTIRKVDNLDKTIDAAVGTLMEVSDMIEIDEKGGKASVRKTKTKKARRRGRPPKANGAAQNQPGI